MRARKGSRSSSSGATGGSDFAKEGRGSIETEEEEDESGTGSTGGGSGGGGGGSF